MSSPPPPPPPPQQPPLPSSSTARYTAKSWREFFDLTTLSLPTSFSEALTRLDKNLPNFKYNYGMLALMITPQLILLSNLTLITLLLSSVITSALYYYFSRRYNASPIVFFGYTVNDRNVNQILFFTGILCIITFSTSSIVLKFYVFWLIAVILHAALKVPRVEVDEDPYARLVDVSSGGTTYNTV